MNNIGLEIKELRTYLGLSAGQLAKLSGLTPAAISQIENDLRAPSLDSIDKICNALDIEPAYLFRTKDKSQTAKEILLGIRISKHDKQEIEKFMQYLAFKKTAANGRGER